jgi:nucleoside-diphosphate-sugar epimerase
VTEPPVCTSPEPDAKLAGDPHWWRDAVLLERADRLEEAEQTVLKAVNHLGAFSSVARLYEERFARLSAAGQKEAAAAAKERAIDWLDVYASMATSGGEGTALSNERDRRIVALGDSPRRR